MKPNFDRIAADEANEVRDLYGAAADAITDLREKLAKWGADDVLDMLDDAASEARWIVEHAEEEARISVEAQWADEVIARRKEGSR